MKKIALILISPNISVPPKGWGAIEKYIWEYKINLEKLGYIVELCYPDNENLYQFDIVQVHTWNQALYLHEKNIPYIFSFDDTHAIFYGKDSHLYQKNLEAIQKSKLTIVHSEYLLDYFNEPNIVYLRHGANPDVFKFLNYKKDSHNLLCVGRTDQDDRKGLLLAIEAAKELNLPITIVGPNEDFFKNSSIKYDKLTIIGNTDDIELNELYNKHTIFLHPSKLETGHPNLTLVESIYCSTPVVGTCNVSLQGMKSTLLTKEDLIQNIKEVIDNYNHYVDNCNKLKNSKIYDWFSITSDLVKFYSPFLNFNMKEILIKEYSNTKKLNISPKSQPVFFDIDFIMGARLTIDGLTSSNYHVKFINNKTNKLIYETYLKKGMWAKPSIQYYIQWRIEVWENNELKFKHIFNCENKKVYIHLSSKALGDTIAWFPYIEEFRKEHNCEMICSTFHNNWFQDKYPNIKFVNPGENVDNVYAMYSIGWYYKDNEIDLNHHPKDVKSYPLQKTASDILGLPYKEIKPNLKIENLESLINESYVVIAPHGSKHASYWNYPGGWQTIIDWLNSQGYKVVMLSRESLGDTWHDSKLGGTLTGVIDKTGNNSFQEVFNIINNSKLLIGLGSGLTWISWALNKPTVLISGFSDPYTEMQSCIRLSASPNVCGGCFNTHKLDAGDWEWCPHHKNTERHFECSKSIKPEQVIKSLKEVLHIY